MTGVQMTKKRKRLRGKVEKIIKPYSSSDTEKAQISVDEAEHLYREIRVENTVTDDKGEEASLKPGAEVDLIVEADSDATLKKTNVGVGGKEASSTVEDSAVQNKTPTSDDQPQTLPRSKSDCLMRIKI